MVILDRNLHISYLLQSKFQASIDYCMAHITMQAADVQ